MRIALTAIAFFATALTASGQAPGITYTIREPGALYCQRMADMNRVVEDMLEGVKRQFPEGCGILKPGTKGRAVKVFDDNGLVLAAFTLDAMNGRTPVMIVVPSENFR